MRARWCVLTALVLVVSWGSPAAAEPLTVTQPSLPLPPGGQQPVQPSAANNAGAIVGSVSVRLDSGAVEVHAVRWVDGTVTDLHPGGVAQSQAVAISQSGIVGIEIAPTLGGAAQASLLIGSRRVSLAPPGATESHVLAVNTLSAALINWSAADGWHLGLWVAGRLVPIGSAQEAKPSGRLNELGQVATVQNGTAFLWTAGRRTTITTGQVTVADLSDRGQVVGAVGPRAFSWRAGQLSYPSLGGPTSAAVAVNNAGQVAGRAAIPDGTATHAFLWSAGAATDLGTLSGPDSQATAINERGQVAGFSSSDVPGFEGVPVVHAAVWSGGTATDLTPGSQTWSRAYTLTDSGYSIGAQQVSPFGFPSSLSFPRVWRVQ